MPLPIHLKFVNRVIAVLKDDARILGIAAGGSWITDSMDAFSDIDLVIVIDSNHEGEISNDRLVIAEKFGSLLSGFTGEHVGEPRLIICLYGEPLLHVDLKFVALSDFAHRVEEPVILWERGAALSKKMEEEDSCYPRPSLQWIEDRFWVWIHYAGTKLGRGEIFEAIEMLSFLRVTVLGPLSLMKNGCLPRGMRYIERDAAEQMLLFIETLSTHDAAGCATACKHAITLYQQLRNYHSTPDLIRRKEAEEQSISFLNAIISTI